MPSQGVTNAANAIINKINNLISSHNSNGNAHQDIRAEINDSINLALTNLDDNILHTKMDLVGFDEFQVKDFINPNNWENAGCTYSDGVLTFLGSNSFTATFPTDSLVGELGDFELSFDYIIDDGLILHDTFGFDIFGRETNYTVTEYDINNGYAIIDVSFKSENNHGIITSEASGDEWHINDVGSLNPYTINAITPVGNSTKIANIRYKANNIISLNDNKEDVYNKVTSISSSSTDTEYPSAKAVFDSLPSVPSASSTIPSADTTSGSVGTGTAWARSDHTHPKSSLYAEASHTHQDVLKKSNTVGLVKNDGTIDTNTFNLDTLDCINENFTLLSLPQIILTYNKLSFHEEERNLLTNYSEGAYVDWGDGTSIETYESTNTLEHDYSDNVQEHTITIYGNILNLYNNSFKNLTGMTSINIPSNVTSLGDYCFYGCTNLTNITIPNSVTSLGSSCFSNCTGLTSVTIPSSVTSLGVNCFRNCTNLVDYQLYWETPPVTWDSNLMPNNADTYFTIPNGTTANYTAKNFPSDKLVERSE